MYDLRNIYKVCRLLLKNQWLLQQNSGKQKEQLDILHHSKIWPRTQGLATLPYITTRLPNTNYPAWDEPTQKIQNSRGYQLIALVAVPILVRTSNVLAGATSILDAC